MKSFSKGYLYNVDTESYLHSDSSASFVAKNSKQYNSVYNNKLIFLKFTNYYSLLLVNFVLSKMYL